MRWAGRKKRGIKVMEAVTAMSYWQTMSKATLILFGVPTRHVFCITTTNVMFWWQRYENVSAS